MSTLDVEKENSMELELKLQQELMLAIDHHNMAQVHDIIHKNGLSPNFILEGKNPVCKAAYHGFVDILDLLVDGGCDVTAPESDNDIWHRRAIHIAASNGHVPFVERLLSLGVDINSTDDDERTPLHWAATYGNTDMAVFLLKEGAAVNITQCDGFTPLHAATCLGHDNVCKVLLKNGAQVNMADRDGWTAFHTSVCYGHANVVKTLMDAGASLTRLTSDNENVIHIAASSGKVDIAKLLVERGADVNAVNLKGNTAFYMAVYYNELEMAKFLIKIGANMYSTNGPRKSPLYLAAMRSSMEFISLFMSSGYNFSCESWLINSEFPVELQKQSRLCDLLHQLATNPQSLKQLCSSVVRKCIKYDGNYGLNTKLEETGLPPSLQDFVSYNDFDVIKLLHTV